MLTYRFSHAWQRADYMRVVDAMASQDHCKGDKFFHGALTQALAALDDDGVRMASELIQACCAWAYS